jgi:hypothetical protein
MGEACRMHGGYNCGRTTGREGRHGQSTGIRKDTVKLNFIIECAYIRLYPLHCLAHTGGSLRIINKYFHSRKGGIIVDQLGTSEYRWYCRTWYHVAW